MGVHKLDPTVTEWLAQSQEELVPVMLYLAEQPVHRLKLELERRHAFRKISVESNLEAALRTKNFGSIETAQRGEAEFTLQFRQELLGTLKRESEPSQTEIEILLSGLGARNVKRLHILNLIRADVPRDAIAILEMDPRIAEVGLDQQQQAQLVNSTISFGAPSFWNLGYTGMGQSVLVLDSGINYSHPAFGGRVLTGIFLEANYTCSSAERTDPSDFNGHGTHVAGIIASAGTTAYPGYRGVAWGVTNIYSAKISCESGRSTSYDPISAVQSALSTTPVTVVNNSNVGTTSLDDDSFSRRIDEIVDTHNLTWVNAAGNAGPNAITVGSPANAYNIISVANMDTFNSTNRNIAQIANSSSRGPTIGGRYKPDIAAPGQNIWSLAYDSNGLAQKSGTSMASPHIAGAAVLLRQRGVRDRLMIKALLINTTDSVSWKPDSGWGYANLTRAEAQADFGVTGSLQTQTGAVAFFKGTLPTGKPLFGALVWNRYVQGSFSYVRNLDFAAYRQSDGQILISSSSVLQNVESVAVPAMTVVTPIVLKVNAFNSGPGTAEPFAIALSEAGFQAASGILLSSNCTVPASAFPSSVLGVNCTFRNNGDLSTFSTSYQVGLTGTGTSTQVNLGPISAGSSVTRSINVVTPSITGTAEVLVTLSGQGYGVTVTATDVRYPLQIAASSALTFTPVGDIISSGAYSGGTITVTTNSSSVAWVAASTSSWITVTAGATGLGNGTVSYSVAANPGTTSRTGAVIIGGIAFLLTQGGTVSTLPSVELTGPVAGSGTNKSFVLRFSHQNGYQQIGVVNALINQYLTGNQACYIAYSQPSQLLYLVNDLGPGSGLSTGLTLGQSGSVSNGQCTINSSGSSAVGSGNTLTLTLNISFKTAFSGNKVVYLASGDTNGGNSGWRTMGYHEVPGSAISYPKPGSMNPVSGIGASGLLSFDFDDQSTVNNLQTMWVLINSAIDGRQACYLAYYSPGNTLYLYPDNGDGSQAASIVLGGANVIENSQCRISASGSSVMKVGSKLTLNLNFVFKTTFAGPKGAWAAVQTLGGAQTSVWKATGALFVPW